MRSTPCIRICTKYALVIQALDLKINFIKKNCAKYYQEPLDLLIMAVKALFASVQKLINCRRNGRFPL